MKYYACSSIENFELAFLGHIDIGNCVTFCCEDVKEKPMIGLREPKETVEEILRLYQDIKLKSIQLAEEGVSDSVLTGCIKCPMFQLKQKEIQSISEVKKRMIYDYIKMINISVYPAPCQAKCIYCNVRKFKRLMQYNENFEEFYNRMFEIIRLLQEEYHLIKPSTNWFIASGEITIHPLKRKLYDLTMDKNVVYCSNCFKYDEQLGDILATNRNAKLSFSIDSGTPETWSLVKGANNWETMRENLNRYHKKALTCQQIRLKYIMLTGINDNPQEYAAVINLLQDLGLRSLEIARNQYETDIQRSVKDTATFIQCLKKANIEYQLRGYSPEEAKQINEIL